MNAEASLCREVMQRRRRADVVRMCGRVATHMVLFLGRWRPVCARHRRYYSDLPMRALDWANVVVDEGDEAP